MNTGGSYTQTAGLTVVDGTLTSPNVNIIGGALTVSNGGTVAGTIITIGTQSTVDAKGGTLEETVINDGTLDPLGTANIIGNYTQNADGTLILDVAGTGPDDLGQLDVSGNAIFGGTIDLTSSMALHPPREIRLISSTYLAAQISQGRQST